MSDREQFRLDARVWTIAVIGMVMKAMQGKANPQVVNEILKAKLG